MRQAILQWKHSGRDAACRLLLDWAEASVRASIASEDLLLPIPTSLPRLRRRGVHHTVELCRHLARVCGCAWHWRYLRRQGVQQRQAGLNAKERARNMRNAFRLDADQAPVWTAYRRVWLVDDVITTGATMHYAACCLRRAGVVPYAWSLAHTPAPS